ncbi:MAG: DUF5711 family protein [Lachnospiraceae bacterium]|nr:DUF5711 family protein [Lachnospiraceae bacterium]
MAPDLRLVKSATDREQAEYEKKIARHRFGIALKVILAIAAFALFAVILARQTHIRVYTTYNRISAETLSMTNGAKTLALKDKLLIYTNDGIRCVDAQGKDVWNQAYEMQAPMVHTCENMVAVGDYNGRRIYVLSGDGPLGTIDTNMPVTAISVAGNGVVAASLEEAGTTWIYLYDSKGTNLAYMKTTMKKSGYPIAFSLSPNGKLLQVSYFYADNGKMKSSVAFYNFGEVGQDKIDNYVSGYDYVDAVVPIVHFMDDSTAFAVADSRLMFYHGNQIPASAAEILLDREIQSVYYSDRYVALVYLNQTGETKYQMDIYDGDGQKKLTLDYDMECQDVLIDKDNVILHAKDQFQIYSMDGKQKFSGNYEKMIHLMFPQGGLYQYTIVTQNSIDVIQLK